MSDDVFIDIKVRGTARRDIAAISRSLQQQHNAQQRAWIANDRHLGRELSNLSRIHTQSRANFSVQRRIARFESQYAAAEQRRALARARAWGRDRSFERAWGLERRKRHRFDTLAGQQASARRRQERREQRADLRRQIGFNSSWGAGPRIRAAGSRIRAVGSRIQGVAQSQQVASSIRGIGNASRWTGRRLNQLQNNLFSYRAMLVGGVAAMGGRSFLEATIGSADDMHRSRLLLRASLGDMSKVDAAFDSAVTLAREIGPLTRQEALHSMRFMVPLAGGNIEQAEQLTRMAKALEVTNPEQSFSGALFSLRELIGAGQVRSLRERFNISGLPTRQEAERMSEEQGNSVAEVYMNAFRGRLEELYGRGGTDAVTALLAAEVDTVRGQFRMLGTIFQDALADIGGQSQGVLNERLEEVLDRARAYVESDSFVDLGNRIGSGLASGANALMDFLESNPIDRADQFLQRHGDLILTVAKLYGINFATGGVVTSAARGLVGGLGWGAGLGGMRAAGSALSGTLLRTGGTAAVGAASTGVGVPAAAGILAVTAAAIGLRYAFSRLSDEVDGVVDRALGRKPSESKILADFFLGPEGPGRGTREELQRLQNEQAVRSIAGSAGVRGRRIVTFDPSANAGFGGYGYEQQYRHSDVTQTKSEIFQLFGGGSARFRAEDEGLYNLISNQLYETIGMRLGAFDEGGQVSSMSFIGGHAAFSSEDRERSEAGREFAEMASGSRGLGDFITSMNAVVFHAREGNLSAINEAIRLLADQSHQSEIMANAFSTAVAGNTLDVRITDITPEIEMYRRTVPGEGTVLLDVLAVKGD